MFHLMKSMDNPSNVEKMDVFDSVSFLNKLFTERWFPEIQYNFSLSPNVVYFRFTKATILVCTGIFKYVISKCPEQTKCLLRDIVVFVFFFSFFHKNLCCGY